MLDFEKLRKIVSPQDALALMRTFRFKKLAANEKYNSSGEIFKKFFYIKKGIIRSYILTDSNEERTMFFRWEGHFFGAYESLLNNEPTKQIFQAIEDCELIEADYDTVDKITSNYPQLLKIRLSTSQKNTIEVMRILESFILDKPIDRYLKLIETQPDIVNRVPDKYIASFIGITPVSLSRIRKRLASQKK